MVNWALGLICTADLILQARLDDWEDGYLMEQDIA